MKFFDLDLNLSSGVYVPREDTYLMVEVLREEIQEEDEVLDMGTGTGILSLVVAENCKKVVGVDVNGEAVELARENASDNGIDNARFLESDLFEGVEERFDLVVFNAPYLPEDKSEENIEGSEQWSGGEGATEVIERFSEEVEHYLSHHGRILLLISSITGLQETEELFAERNFKVSVERKKKIPWETLFVLEITN